MFNSYGTFNLANVDTKTKTIRAKIDNYFKLTSLFHNYILFKYSTIRVILGLPHKRIRTRSGRQKLINTTYRSFFLKNIYPYKNKYQLAEFFNLVWYVFFTYEWYITFFKVNKLKQKNHWKNIHFTHKELKYFKIISHGKRKKKSKKNLKKKKATNKSFNIGFYYLDTVKFFKQYLLFRQ